MLPRLCALTLLAAGRAVAEDGSRAWLRYAPWKGLAPALPATIVALNVSSKSPIESAALEVQKGLKGIFCRSTTISNSTAGCSGNSTTSSTIVIGTLDAFANSSCSGFKSVPHLGADGFWLSVQGDAVKIVGQNERGTLYGAFEYLSRLAQGNFSDVAYASSPGQPIRWVNQWDNLDGSIERGYGGVSIFYANGAVVTNLTRAGEYARILASIGINAVVVNNVNADAKMVSTPIIQGLGRIADVFRPWGVQLAIALNFASPQTLGGLPTFDPLDPTVVSWWTNATNQLYAAVPDMAGYLVKANSEGQPGPLTYNRTLADGANLFAKALQPHGGVVMFRAFVYNQLNESDWHADRADAAVQFFKELDGEFDDNVVVQIKYGPIDFQVREPASPLFANLLHTNTAIELQVAQEYLGQQCHLVYLPPLWKTVLDFDMRVDYAPSVVSDIISGKRFQRPLGGSAAVVNVGTNATWLGSHMAMSNLYAYGRLAWDASLDPEAILNEWTRLTFGSDPAVLATIADMSMTSWPAYENYTGNLGIQTLTDILYTHYGPNPASQDNNGWGQWTRADNFSIGMDRTVANGTGFAGQYPPEVAQAYESLDATPDNLVLWFHHVPYTHLLHEGKTVIQHFYDAHYAGASAVQAFPAQWAALAGKVDAQRLAEVGFRLTYQAGHAIVWRDAITNYYRALSGITDARGRVGHYAYRIEAEAMALSGYKTVKVTPFECASNASAIQTVSNKAAGTASVVLDRVASGTYDLAVNYFDVVGGRATWQVYLGDSLVGTIRGALEDTLGKAGSTMLDGHSATRMTFNGVLVKAGDVLRIVGTPDGSELAPLDYVSLLPQGHVD
jgi:alpha-glucuronidase